MIEAIIIKGLTQVFQNLVMSELNDLTADMVKEAVGEELDMEAQEMREMIAVLNAIAKNTGMTQQEIINLTKE